MHVRTTINVASFWARVDRRGPDECWPWLGYVNPEGYGRFLVGSRTDESVTIKQAQLVAYELMVGPIPKGKALDHLCHNADLSCPGGVGCLHRRCVNPRHLAPATWRENTLRGRTRPAANAAKTHCDRGHPFDKANTYSPPRGKRECRACRLLNQRRRTKERRAVLCT